MTVIENQVVTVETVYGIFEVTVIESSDTYGDFTGLNGSSLEIFNVEQIVK